MIMVEVLVAIFATAMVATGSSGQRHRPVTEEVLDVYLLAGLLLASASLGCSVPTDVTLKAPCSARVVNYYNGTGGLDSTVTLVDTLACPRT